VNPSAAEPFPEVPSDSSTYCFQLLAAWVQLENDRGELSRNLFKNRSSSEQIQELLDQNEQQRNTLLAATTDFLKRIKT